MSYVFLSYVRQDADIVDQIAKELSRAGKPVWLDRQKIKPGEIWPESIRVAITNAAILVVCFSDNFFGRDRSIANEELHLAIEEFNRRTWGQPWLIPARLSDCTIPPYPIRSNLTLSEIHAVDLTATNWRAGIVEISGLFHDWESRNLHSLQPPLSSDQAKIIIGLVSRKLSINLGE